MSGLTPFQKILLSRGVDAVKPLAQEGVEYIERHPEVKPYVKLLRSLPLAKQCRHLGERLTKEEVEAKQLVGCRTCNNDVLVFHCKLPGARKFNDGPYTRRAECMGCKDWQKPHHENPAPTVTNSWSPIRLDHTNLFPSIPGIRFNPSIIESGNDYILSFRHGWAGSNIYACRLDENFKPYGECKKLELGKRGCNVGREDGRLFRLNNKLHIAFTGYTGRLTNVCFARLNEDELVVEDRFLPKAPGITGWQKNWSMFDYQGVIHAVYETSPNHRILRIEGDRAEFVYSTPFKGAWSGGYMRGGASPVLVGNEWFHFFHGCYNIGGRRRYCTGVTTFRAEPPFDVLRYTPNPIDEADLERNHDCYADVLFIGGAVYRDGKWITASGIHDRWSEIRVYDANEIERQLVSA